MDNPIDETMIEALRKIHECPDLRGPFGLPSALGISSEMFDKLAKAQFLEFGGLGNIAWVTGLSQAGVEALEARNA